MGNACKIQQVRMGANTLQDADITSAGIDWLELL